MSEVTINCENLNVPSIIQPTECIGNSLFKINDNFANLKLNDDTICDTLANLIQAVESSLINVVQPPIGTVVSWFGRVCDGNPNNELPPESIATGITAFPIKTDNTADLNWAVCTGVIVYDQLTPDLIGRFIVGAGAKATEDTFNDAQQPIIYPRTTGGVELYRLQPSEIPQLNIEISTTSTNIFSKDPVLLTAQDTTRSYLGSLPTQNKRFVSNVSFLERRDFIESTGISSAGEANNLEHENRPPYYALYYIMRVK